MQEIETHPLVWGPSLLSFPFPPPPFFSGPKHEYITIRGKELVLGVGNAANSSGLPLLSTDNSSGLPLLSTDNSSGLPLLSTAVGHKTCRTPI
jgi:hypothetical protein